MYKKYIIWGYYGQEGWSILFQTDDKQELLSQYLDWASRADKIVVTQFVTILLGFPND